MAEFPFLLSIIRTYQDKSTERLSCTDLLRIIPGRREVYDALWNEKSVIAKVFSHRISARRHLKREWQGLSRLKKRGLNSPAPLFYGKTENGRWAVVVEKIADSSTILDIFQKTSEPAKKLNLLVLVCRELAKQHDRGVLQKDLHLGNFLLKDNKIFALDPAQMRFLSRKAGKKKSVSQLGMLASFVPDNDTESIATLYKEYFQARNWHFEKADQASFRRQVAAHRKKEIRKALKKCLRTSKRYLRIKVGSYIAVFDKGLSEDTKPLDLFKQIDTLMDTGQILKNGNTCCVSRLKWNGKDVVVKRYNHKGLIHSIRHTIKRSRARRAWLHGHRLGMLDIPTPKPLAYIEQRSGPLIWKSYLVNEYVKGQKLYNFLQDGRTRQNQHSIVTRKVKDLIDKMGKNRITHGDLKHTNILITDNGPVLTDLDGMKVHKWTWIYKHRRRKDLRRFSKQLSPSFVSKTI